MEYLILPIIQHISNGMPELMVVDEDYGQLEVVDDDGKLMYELTYPAVLVDLEQVDWSEIQGGSQFGEARIKARLIIDCYEDTHIGSGTELFIQQREEMRARMHQLLQGFHPSGSAGSGLVRIESKFYTWNHGIKVYQETYTCRVSEVITRQTTPPSSPVRIAIETSIERP